MQHYVISILTDLLLHLPIQDPKLTPIPNQAQYSPIELIPKIVTPSRHCEIAPECDRAVPQN